MPRRVSSRDRLERLQAEKAAEQREKEEKKVAKKASPAKPKPKAKAGSRKKAAASVRMKLVWAVCKANGDIVDTFPYPEKAEAKATAERMSAAGRPDFIVKPEKVPME